MQFEITSHLGFIFDNGSTGLHLQLSRSLEKRFLMVRGKHEIPITEIRILLIDFSHPSLDQLVDLFGVKVFWVLAVITFGESGKNFLLFFLESFRLNSSIRYIFILLLFEFQVFLGCLGHAKSFSNLGCFELIYDLDAIECSYGVMLTLFGQYLTIQDLGIVFIYTIQPVNC